MAAILLLAPHTPLIFMGQEFDEEAPFQFFTDFGDPTLQKAVSEGRRNEFKDFAFQTTSPTRKHQATFERSRLNWQQARDANDMLVWYRSLLELRRNLFRSQPRNRQRAALRPKRRIAPATLACCRKMPCSTCMCPARIRACCSPAISSPAGRWRRCPGGSCVYHRDEDGYAVRVWTK